MTATTIHRFEYDKAAATASDAGLLDQNYPQSVMTLRTHIRDTAAHTWESHFIDDETSSERESIYPVGGGSSGSPAAGWSEFRTNRLVSMPFLRAPPRITVEQHAHAYFTNHYLDIKPQGLDPGYLDVLSLVTQRRNKGKCLSLCLSTLAFAAFSRRPVSRNATIDTQSSYSEALKAVNDAIGTPGSIFDDEILASIVILALVEVSSSVPTTSS
jgi:hypothetical protein